MPAQQQKQETREAVRNNIKGSVQIRDGNSSTFGKLREFTLGRLLRVAAFVARAIIPTKRAPEDDKRLLTETGENDEHIKHHIARVIPLFQGSPQGSTEVHRHPAIPTLLETIYEVNSDSREHFPLEPSESEIVLDALQQKLSAFDSLGSSTTDDDGTRAALLQVLYWFTLRTGISPKEMTISTSDIECQGREDYGSGGMNDILKGRRKGELVALKHPRVIGMVQPSRRKKIENMFHQYSLVGFNMHHPHVVPVLGIIDEPKLNGFYMVLPWMEGGDLRSHLDELVSKRRLSGQDLVKNVNRWIHGIASGLSYLHRFGVVHGDVRGENVQVDDNGQIRLTAFGSTALVTAGGYCYPHQSPAAWVAPELINPERYNLSAASPSLATDVYAFGCMCVEMPEKLYTCQSPFPDLGEAQILNKVLKGRRPRRPNKPGEEMQDILWQFVSRCWDSNPSRRPSVDGVFSQLGLTEQEPAGQ